MSSCGRYRYVLTRSWDAALPEMCWVMLNPSTADADRNDPTIRRCTAFARRHGAGGIVVVNLFAYRATMQADLARATDPVGARNDNTLLRWTEGRRTLAAWGRCDTRLKCERRDAVLELLRGRRLECLGTTKDGHPRHPLYLRDDTRVVAFTCAGAGDNDRGAVGRCAAEQVARAASGTKAPRARVPR